MTTTNNTGTVKITGSNHDFGGSGCVTVIRPANDYKRTVKLMKECGYRTVTVE